MINVGEKGTFLPTKKFSTSPTDIDAIFENLRAKEISRIAVYFHGGLVNEHNGVAGAQLMNEHLEEADTYPISFVWETGFGETIKERIFSINQTKLFHKLVKFVMKCVGTKLGIGIGGRGFSELTDTDILKELRERNIPFENIEFLADNRLKLKNQMADEVTWLEKLIAELNLGIHSDEEFLELIEDIDVDLELIDQDVIELHVGDDSRGVLDMAKFSKALAKVTFKVIKRFVIHRDHGFYPTVFEEVLRELYIANFGAWLWSGMKNKASEMWQSNQGLSGDKMHVGMYFIEKLNAYAKNREVSIDLVAHSAGAIAVCNMLRAINGTYKNFSVRNILFMAPACTSELFHKEVVTKQYRFKRFRMFTMNDVVESNDALIDKLPGIYPRSLLYLVSGILEKEGNSYDEPILGMERYFNWEIYTANNPVLNAVSTFLNQANRVVLSPTNGNEPGLNSMADDHGFFNEDPETLNSIKSILNERVNQVVEN
mgnify:CR=1 FL=1